jgi:hypothetical protein
MIDISKTNLSAKTTDSVKDTLIIGRHDHICGTGLLCRQIDPLDHGFTIKHAQRFSG